MTQMIKLGRRLQYEKSNGRRRASQSVAVAYTARLIGDRRRPMRFVGSVMEYKWKAGSLPGPTSPALRRIWANVRLTDGCWVWTGSIHPDSGYPREISVDGSRKRSGRLYRPQRLMFHWFKYAIPPDFTVDHLCNNRRCVNPDHMESVTHGENASRGNKKAYCKRGHKQTSENRYEYRSQGKPRGRCRLCIKERRIASPKGPARRG